MTLNKNGEICGPTGKAAADVRESLIIGHKRSGGSGNWKEIRDALKKIEHPLLQKSWEYLRKKSSKPW